MDLGSGVERPLTTGGPRRDDNYNIAYSRLKAAKKLGLESILSTSGMCCTVNLHKIVM